MKVSGDDDPPRSDGWFSHKGVWGEVTVGTVIADRNSKARRWEVIATSHGGPVQYGYTLWFRVREQSSGEEYSLPPRLKVDPVTILTQNPRDQHTAPPTEPSDTEAIMLLVTELDAELLASRDNETGEVVCPDYIYRSHIPGQGDRQQSRGLRQHLEVAHQLVAGAAADLNAIHALHTKAHNPSYPDIGKGGFAHRHIPEDLTQF